MKFDFSIITYSTISMSLDPSQPTVLLIIGANGMGKTTTIGKLAYRLRNEYNKTVLLGACDTFRAAAVNQLAEWAHRANVSIEVPTGADVILCQKKIFRRLERSILRSH